MISHLTGPNIIEAVGEAQQECVPKITERERQRERERVRERESERERDRETEERQRDRETEREGGGEGGRVPLGVDPLVNHHCWILIDIVQIYSLPGDVPWVRGSKRRQRAGAGSE